MAGPGQNPPEIELPVPVRLGMTRDSGGPELRVSRAASPELELGILAQGIAPMSG